MKKVLILSLLFAGCASAGIGLEPTSRPRLYPNDHLQQVGQAQADRDINDCMAMAEEYTKDENKWKDAAVNTGKGAVVGAATGAVAGAIFGNTGRGTAAGAAVGTIASLANELDKMDVRNPSYERFAEHCLEKRGYEVIEWR